MITSEGISLGVFRRPMTVVSPNPRVGVFVFLLMKLGLLVAIFDTRWGSGSGGLATLALSAVCVWISIADLRHREIPDSASIIVTLMGAVLWLGHPEELMLNSLVACAVILFLAVAGAEAWKRTGRELLGLGDAKLIGAGTIVVGWDALWLLLFLSSVGGIGAALARRARSFDEGIPFGPFLAYAILVTHMIVGPSL